MEKYIKLKMFPSFNRQKIPWKIASSKGLSARLDEVQFQLSRLTPKHRETNISEWLPSVRRKLDHGMNIKFAANEQSRMDNFLRANEYVEKKQ